MTRFFMIILLAIVMAAPIAVGVAYLGVALRGQRADSDEGGQRDRGVVRGQQGPGQYMVWEIAR